MNGLDDNNDDNDDGDANAEHETENEEDMDGLWNVCADIQTKAATTTTATTAAEIEQPPDKVIVCEDAIVSSFAVAIQSYTGNNTNAEATSLAALELLPCLAAWQPAPLLLLQQQPSPKK
jgi:hypothetical protein